MAMKATFEFDLSDPDDIRDHLRHTKSLDMALALSGIQDIWRRYKHSEKDPTSEEIFDVIREIFRDNNIDLDELIQ